MVIWFFLVLSPNSVLGMCLEPDPVINSYRHKDDNFLEEGSWLNYTCYMNYVHYSGDITRQCSDGNFTGPPPVCIYSCGPPPNITSMLTEIPEFTIPGSIVNYTCQFNTSITLTAVCDTHDRKWMYDNIICPQQGNLFQSLMSGSKNVLEAWASVFYDNRTNTCRQSAVSSQPNMNFTMLENVDLQSISVTFGAFTGALGPVIVKLVSTLDQSNTTHIIGTCGGIFENLNDNATIFIECSPPSYGLLINIKMVLEPNVTGLITVCEFKTVGNLRNEGCYGQPTFNYGAEVKQRDDLKVRLQCVAGFYWLRHWEVVKCSGKMWPENSFECAQRDDLIQIHSQDFQHSYAFDQTLDTCKKLDESIIIGADAQNRTFIVLSVTVVLFDYVKEGIGLKVIKGNGDKSECYFDMIRQQKILLCQFEENTEANTIVFYRNSTSTDNVRLCELYVNGFYKDTNDQECYRSHPSNYQGKMNITWNDLSCERWDQVPKNLNFNMENMPDDSVKDAENYCRNPDNSALVPWCFVNNYTERTNCMVQKCSLFCSLSSDGTDYEARQTYTSSDDQCVIWSKIEDTNKVQEYTKDLHTNRCKNFGDSFSSPWCFTDLSGQSFGVCSTIHCAKTINSIQLNQPSMLTQHNIHPYCYWNKNTSDTTMPFYEQYELSINQHTLQSRCLEGVKSVFCYGESDVILTYYHVDSCDTNATTEPITKWPNKKISSMVNLVTKSITLPNVTDFPLDLIDERCMCLCVKSQILDDVTLDKRIEDIIVSLSVEKSNLTSVLRRKTCANDERPSVIYIGSGAVAIFSMFLSLIILPDIIYLVKGILSVIKDCRYKQHPQIMSSK